MATVQEGNLSAPLYGSLWEGTKFWLSLQVPTRAYYTKLIKANGGALVNSEKEAEVCLVDHLKEVPMDSKVYSYRYIDQCIKERKLVDLEEHRVTSKKVSSGAPSQWRTSKSRLGRNQFTQEDDDILFRAVSAPGVKLAGNVVYQKLADDYPQHTMHSWRARWVSHYAHIMAHGSHEPKTEPESPPKAIVSRKKEPLREKDVNDSDSDSDNQLRSAFTEAERKLLMDKAEAIDSSVQPMKIFKALSRQYPGHTKEEWSACFYGIVLPEFRKSGDKKRAPPEERGVGASFHSSKSLQLQSPIQLESRPAELAKKDVRSRHPGREKDSGLPVSSPTPVKRRLPGNQIFTIPPRHECDLVPERLPQWRVVVNKPTPPAASGELATPAKPQSSRTAEVPHPKRKRDEDAEIPGDRWAVKRGKYASMSEIPSTPGASPRRRRQVSVELGVLVPLNPEKPTEQSSTTRSTELVEVVKTPVRTSLGKSTATNQPTKVSGVPAKLPKKPTLEEPSKSILARSTPAKLPKKPTPEEPSESVSTKSAPAKLPKKPIPEEPSKSIPTNSTPAKLPKKPIPEEPSKPVSTKSTPAKSTPVKSPKNRRVSYENMSTQAIFNTEIDQDAFEAGMNFELPLFDGGDEELYWKPSEPAAVVGVKDSESGVAGEKLSSESQPLTASEQAGIEEMTRYLACCKRKFKLSEETVIEAVERTSGVKAAMEVLLAAISKGVEPGDIASIWSKEDDEVLMGSDSRKMKELSDRKGDAEITRRMDFLNLWNLA